MKHTLEEGQRKYKYKVKFTKNNKNMDTSPNYSWNDDKANLNKLMFSVIFICIS